MRCALLQLVKDCIANALSIATKMRIPEPQRFDSAGLRIPFALRVVALLVGEAVLAAVQLDVQFHFLAKEIERVIAEGMLAGNL